MPLSGNLIWQNFQAFNQSGNNNVNEIWQYIDDCQPNYHKFGPVRGFERKLCPNI